MKKNVLVASELDFSFPREVASTPGGEDISKCYACGTCTVSCPVFEIDSRYNPRKIIRMVLLGMREEVLSSEIIWLCANCYTCFERCPQDVKFTSVIHALRTIAIREARAGKRKIKSPAFFFATSFLKSIELHGRLWEPELVTRVLINLKDIRKILAFLPLGIRMFRKGKLALLPSRIKHRKVIRQIFDRAGKAHRRLPQ
jgi:heterodisulfide reductase subunit C